MSHLSALKLGLAASLVLAGCQSKTPEEAARASSVLITDGFTQRGGVVIADKYVITDLALVKNSDAVKIVDGAGKTLGGAVLSRDAENELAVLQITGEGLPAADLGDAGALAIGATLTAVVYDGEGKPQARKGQFTGWRYHEGRALIEHDLEVRESWRGTALFDEKGHAVGVLRFSLNPKLNYALPLEYATTGKGVAARVAGGPGTSDAFAEQRAAAAKHGGPLTKPFDLDTVEHEYTYSRTAIVGRLTILDKRDSDTRTQPLKFKLTSTDAANKTETVLDGALSKPDVQWAQDDSGKEKKAAALRATFGDVYVNANFAPYDFGELRYRIALTRFCRKVSADSAYNFTLALADGRTAGPFGYQDMVNVCAGHEDNGGEALEQAWGMTAAAAPAAAEEPAPAGKAKPSKKTKKPKKKGRR